MARPALSAIAELLPSMTGLPPLRAFGCGVLAAGAPVAGCGGVVVLGALPGGPPVCAARRAVDGRDHREVDAITPPERLVPRGHVPDRRGLSLATARILSSLPLATTRGRWGLGAVALPRIAGASA